MQRKRAVAAPLMTTQPGFTGWISNRPVVQGTSQLNVAPNNISSYCNSSTSTVYYYLLFFCNLFFLMLYSLYGVWSAEPCICPSPLISRCTPALAAYRCLRRTTCPHPLAICGPWSGRGTETTPAKKKVLEKDTVTMMRSNMFPENLDKWSVAALLHC